MSALVTNFSSDGQKRTVSFLSYSYQWPLCVLAPDAEPRQPGCSFWGQKIKAQVHQEHAYACACVPATGGVRAFRRMTRRRCRRCAWCGACVCVRAHERRNRARRKSGLPRAAQPTCMIATSGSCRRSAPNTRARKAAAATAADIPGRLVASVSGDCRRPMSMCSVRGCML